MPRIHPTALVSSDAVLSDDAEVGAYAIVDGPVHLGPGTRVLPHSHVLGNTRVGQRCTIGPAAYVGTPPQHLRADPNVGSLIVGDDVVIRETATLHRSITAGDAHATRVGDGCFIMASAHVGHDCVVGPGAILAHGAMLGGHCPIGAGAFIGGGTAIHQHTRIGRLSIISGNEAIAQDLLPFAAARYAGMRGYNAVGCKRSGMPREVVVAIRAAFQCFHTHRSMKRAVEEVRRSVPDVAEVRELLAFIASSKRGILPSVESRQRGAAADDGDA